MGFKKEWILPTAALATAGAAAGLARSQYERDRFTVERTVIRSAKIRAPRRLVFLSDLHDKEFGDGNRKLLRAIRAAKPDAVLIGGDMMVAKSGRADLAVTAQLLSGLADLCPVYYGNGNHEQRLLRERDIYGAKYRELQRLLRANGVVHLSDASADFGEDIRISGLNIDERYYRNFVPAHMGSGYLQRHLGPADSGRFQILLAHSPLFFPAYRQWGADLSLAGHFHGGTIRLPLLGGVMTPQYQFFLPWCAGTFARAGRYMIVSRGLGTHSINIRIGNRPQVVVVELQPEDEFLAWKW